MIDANLSPGHLCRLAGYWDVVDGTIVEWLGREVAFDMYEVTMVRQGSARNEPWEPGRRLRFRLSELEAIPHD